MAGHKKDIRGCHFRSDEEVRVAVEEWLNGKDPNCFISGLMAVHYTRGRLHRKGRGRSQPEIS